MMSLKLTLSLATGAAIGALVLLGQQSTADPAAGRAAYQANCAGCHQADLAGRGEAPQLAGSNFMRNWGTKTVRELAAYIQASMPPGKVGTLSSTEYSNLAAFILQANSTNGVAVTSAVPAPPAAPRGVTVAGEIKNYRPVTDAMLRNPDPADWLMIRRNYQAWNFSPLAQINTANVKDLKLKWIWR